MYPIAEKYQQRYGDEAVQMFVDDLMRDNPTTYKAGYSRENAIIAAADAFDIDRDAVLRHLQEDDNEV